MCFVLYIGANVILPEVPVNENNLGIHTECLNENDAAVASHFSTRNVIYLGSTQGCGCGFRHALLESNGNEWMPVVYEKDEDMADDQINMLGLHNYLRHFIDNGEKVELYGIWDGDYNEKPLSKQELLLADLLKTTFYLKERGFYIIKIID
jgi:hypothetical protein